MRASYPFKGTRTGTTVRFVGLIKLAMSAGYPIPRSCPKHGLAIRVKLFPRPLTSTALSFLSRVSTLREVPAIWCLLAFPPGTAGQQRAASDTMKLLQLRLDRRGALVHPRSKAAVKRGGRRRCTKPVKQRPCARATSAETTSNGDAVQACDASDTCDSASSYPASSDTSPPVSPCHTRTDSPLNVELSRVAELERVFSDMCAREVAFLISLT